MPNTPIHNGIEATAMAARPEETCCWASTTQPLPRPSSSAPITARLRHCAALGTATPRQRRTAYITPPASTKRVPDTPISGGHPPSRARRIAR